MDNTTIYTNYKSIPHELKTVPNWVCWKLEERRTDDGSVRTTKIPYQSNGKKAKADDKATWSTFTDCVAACEYGEFDGIGFEFSKDVGYIGVDLDKCYDIENQTLEPWASAIVEKLDSYTEFSPSGKGLHTIVKGVLPPAGRRNGRLEIYGDGRFFTMSGKPFPNTSPVIRSAPRDLWDIHEENFPAAHEAHTPPPPSQPSNGLEETELLTRALASKSDFKSLWEGNSGDDHSQADFRLCCHLAFWCGRDATKIDAMFRRSGLMRPKWDKKHGARTYGAMTVAKAIESTKSVYSPTMTNVEAPTVPPKAPTHFTTDRIDLVYDMLSSTRLSTMQIPPIEFYEKPFLVKNAITAFTGEAAHGKSTFVLSLLHRVANKHRDAMVIYCDADNPAAIAQERSERLRGTFQDRISYWGGFLTDADGTLVEPWDIESPDWFLLIKKVKDSGKEPIIVFDTLNSFMNGQNENDNAVVGKIMNHMRAMTNQGATVIIIHHTGKSETSKESRGASSFKGGVDAGFKIDSLIVDSTIKTMMVKPWKNRLGKTETTSFYMADDGQLVRAVRNAKEDACLQFILKNPGNSANQLEKLRMRGKNGFSRDVLRDTIDRYLLCTPPALKKIDDKLYDAEESTTPAPKPPTIQDSLFEIDIDPEGTTI